MSKPQRGPPTAIFDVAEKVGTEGKLVYLSLGSLGCMDIPLMQRVIDSLDQTPHRVIVSMGPLHDQLTLGERMWGEQFVPQTAIVPQCDVMITHGGNNTVGEAFSFGVPTIVLPLFWDQYDNAQRIDECGFGVRLSTYEFSDEELHTAIERLSSDTSFGDTAGCGLATAADGAGTHTGCEADRANRELVNTLSFAV